MIELQRAIFLKLSQDSELLNLLGLTLQSGDEISKRITPTPPPQLSQEHQPLIHFKFLQTYPSFRSNMMEFRPIQFRVWSDDTSTVEQQTIGKRILALMVGQKLRIKECEQYTRPYYVTQSQIPGVVNDLYGYSVQIKIATRVEYYNNEGEN